MEKGRNMVKLVSMMSILSGFTRVLTVCDLEGKILGKFIGLHNIGGFLW